MREWDFRSFGSCHRKNRGSGRLACLMVMVALVSILTPSASARDDFNRMYPDEITVSDLELYGGWLNLSDSQRVAVGQFHRDYLARFAELKENVIDPHKYPSGPWETFGQWLPVVEEYWRETEAIRDKIQLVDGTLFTEIDSILADSQLPAMQRVRDHRMRQTLRVVSVLGMTQRMSHDMTKFAYDLDLSEADTALLDPLLVDYERRLTTFSKTLHKEAVKMQTAPLKEHVRRGFGDMPLRSDLEEWQKTYRETWIEQGGKIEKLALEIDELNETLTRRVEQTLSHEGAQAWLDEYVTRCFQRAGRPREKRRLVMKALESVDRLSVPDQATIETLMLEFDTSLRRIERKFMELELLYLPRVHFTLIGHGVERPNMKYKEDINDVEEDFESLLDSFLERMKQTLTPNGFEQWDLAYAAATKRKSKTPTHADGEKIYNVSYTPLFLAARGLNRIIRTLNLNDEQQAALREAHKAYGNAQKTIETDLPENPRLNLGWGWMAPYPSAIRIRLRQADERIFGTLERMLEKEEDQRKVNWFRNARRRMFLAHGESMSGAGALDLTLFILDSGLPVEDLESAADLIDEYDTQSMKFFEKLHSTYTTNYEWALENQEYKGHTYPHLDPFVKAQQAITKLNVDTMEAIGERLESDAGAAMMELFTRYCYRPVFDDPKRDHAILSRAKRVDGLDTSQRDALLVLEVSYLEEYEKLTDAMMEAAKYTLHWGYGIGETRPNPSGFEEAKAYKRHRFLRDELNAATIVKLEMMLTAEQFESMGGLPRK